MMIVFPFLHEELAGGGLPEQALFLDPGVDARHAQAAARRVRPQGLPLTPAQGRRLVDDWLAFGAQFAKPGEMAAMAAAAQGHAASPLGLAIQSQLEAMERGEANGSQDDGRLRAQLTLLLAWAMEERLLDLRGLSAGLAKGREKFAASLGFADDDMDELRELGLGEPNVLDDDPAGELAASWPRILKSMTVLAPAGSLFYVDHPAIEAEIVERGADFGAAAATAALPAGAAESLEQAELQLLGGPVIILRPRRG